MMINYVTDSVLPLVLKEGIAGQEMVAVVLGRVSGQHPPQLSTSLGQYAPSENRLHTLQFNVVSEQWSGEAFHLHLVTCNTYVECPSCRIWYWWVLWFI